MWFKNIQLYRFDQPFEHTADSLNELLTQDALMPCPAAAFSNSGWLAPGAPESDIMMRVVHHHILICLGVQEKLMPPAIIRELVQDQVAQIEHEESRKLSRSEKLTLTERQVSEMLPQAFIRKSKVYGLINLKKGWLIVDQSNLNKAEAFVERLRHTLGSLSAIPLQVKESAASILTGWVADATPKEIELSDSCELIDPIDAGAVVRVRGVDLNSSEIATHLESGKRVSKLQITWNEHLSCEITDVPDFRKLKFEGIIKEEADQQAGETLLDKMDTDLAIMGPLLETFLLEMVELFGGFPE